MDIATCRLLARYNQWMNRKLIVAAAALPGSLRAWSAARVRNML